MWGKVCIFIIPARRKVLGYRKTARIIPQSEIIISIFDVKMRDVISHSSFFYRQTLLNMLKSLYKYINRR